MNFGVGATFFRGSFEVEGVFALDPSFRGVDFLLAIEDTLAEGFGDTYTISSNNKYKVMAPRGHQSDETILFSVLALVKFL